MALRRKPILGVTLLAFIMRLAFLGHQSLWYDEAFSLAVARADWPIFWAALLTDGVHPPGYYLALKAALTFFGSSEFALRFMSVLAGTLAVPLMDRLGRVLGGRRWGMAAALLLAVNPFALWYAQEARMYSLLLCLTIAGGYVFWRLLVRPGLGTWLGLCLISALSFLVHYFAFVFSLAQFVYLVITLRRTHRALRWWATAQTLAFVPFFAWGIAIANRESRNFGIGWIHPPSLLDLPLTLSNLALTLNDPGQVWVWAGLALVIVAAVAGIATEVKSGAFVPMWDSGSSGPGGGLLATPCFYLLAWLVVPILFTWLFSLRLPLYVDRFLIICLPALVLLSGTISLSSTWLAHGTMILLVMASAITSTRLWFDLDLTKEDWRTAATYIQSQEQPGDVLVMRDLQNSIPFGYYYRGNLKLQIAQINQDMQSLDDLSRGYQRLWLVYRRPFEPTHALSGSQPFNWQNDDEPAIQGWLVSHASGLAQETTFPGVYVLLYRLPPHGG